jgi:hypothetical protein
MYKVMKMSGQWYASQLESEWLDDEDDQENISQFAREGIPVTLCDTLEDFSDVFAVPVDEIEIV